MSRRLPELLRAHRLRLKAEWRCRLSMQPIHSPLALPEILQHGMNDTLDQLDELLRHRRAPRPRSGRANAACGCELNPLLGYFATGRDALFAELGAELSEPEEKILERAWQILATREIRALCSACRHPTCARRPPELQRWAAAPCNLSR